MSSEKSFKICDPLYNYIYLEKDELALFNHPTFQRLRSIRQLGFSDQAFPSATHTRFTHSLGTSHLAGEAFDSIFQKKPALLTTEKKQLFKKSLRMASLLHDIGHGPFSHSSECFLPPLKSLKLSQYLTKTDRKARHEDYSLKIILEEEGIKKALRQMGLEPFHVASILHPDFQKETDFWIDKGLNFLPLLRQILSSPFDVDRMDYLHRDSLFCGVRYGLIDCAWLIGQMSCHIPKNQEKNEVFLSIDSSALYTLESLILGRQHMRLVVYFHHKSIIYNEILKKYSKECGWTLPSNLADYMLWTDSKLLEELRKSNNSWAKKIVNKTPYFRLYEKLEYEYKKDDKDFLFSQLQEKLLENNIEFIVVDSQKNSIKPAKTDNQVVFLENKALSEVKEWNKNPHLLSIPPRRIKRVYVPQEPFSQAQKVLKSLL